VAAGDLAIWEGNHMETLKEILKALFALGDDEKKSLTEGERQEVAEYFGFELVEEGEVETQLSEMKKDLELKDDKIALLLEENKSLTAELTEIKKAGLDEKIDGMIETALSEGKILPAQKELWLEMAKKDPDGTEKLLAAKGAEVDLTVHGTGTGGGEGTFDEEAFAVYRNLNPELSEEEARKEFVMYSKEVE